MFVEETEDFFIDKSFSNFKMPSMHCHSTYELYYLEAGSREYFVEDKFFSVTSGSFVLISPYKLHRTGGDYASRTLIGFSKDFLKKTFSNSAIDKILKCFDKTLIVPTEAERESLVSKLRQIEKTKDETLATIALFSLLIELAGCKSQVFGDERISEIIEYINENYSHIQSIEQIADNFFISKYHLCRMFKASMKITVIDYLNNIKIKNACAYLRTTNKNITDIALLTGFNSPTYFTNVFKKIMGKSPSQYKKTGA